MNNVYRWRSPGRHESDPLIDMGALRHGLIAWMQLGSDERYPVVWDNPEGRFVSLEDFKKLKRERARQNALSFKLVPQRPNLYGKERYSFVR